MSAINLIQSSSYTLTFGFEIALFAFSYGTDKGGWGPAFSPEAESFGSGVLFSHGCLVNDTLNCTAACQNSSLIFANPYTMQNCMVLASLGPTMPYPDGSLIRRNRKLDSGSVTVLTDFSIHLGDPQFPSLASDVNKTISDCLQQYRDRNYVPYSNVDYSCSIFDNIPSVHGDTYDHANDYCYPDICMWNGPSHLNPDIVGIGV